MKKFSAIAVLVASALSSAAWAGDSHNRYDKVVANLKDSLVITDAKVAADIAKYASGTAKLKLIEAFKDGELTAAEIKSSGISDHHFYTGYLASAKNQTEYDKILKEMNGGNNVDDNYVNNRDLKAHGSMLMNQVDGKINFAVKGQDAKMQSAHDHYTGRMDNLKSGLEQLGEYVANNVGGTNPEPNPEPNPNPGTVLNANQKVFQLKDKDGKEVPGLVGYEYTVGKNGETTIGYEVVKNDMEFVDHNGNSIKIAGAGDNYDALKEKFDGAMNGRPDGMPEFGLDRPMSSEALEQVTQAVANVSNKVDAVVSGLQNADWSSVGGSTGGDAGKIEDLEQRLEAANGHLSQVGDAVQNNANNIQALGGAFQAQANQTAAEIARLDGRIDALEEKTDKMKAGIAGANAIASLTQYTGQGEHHVAIGIGGYDGAAAFAGGYTYAVDKNTTVRATLSYDSEGEVGYGVSYGHSW